MLVSVLFLVSSLAFFLLGKIAETVAQVALRYFRRKAYLPF